MQFYSETFTCSRIIYIYIASLFPCSSALVNWGIRGKVTTVRVSSLPIIHGWEGAFCAAMDLSFAPDASKGVLIWFEDQDLLNREGGATNYSQPGLVILEVV